MAVHYLTKVPSVVKGSQMKAIASVVKAASNPLKHAAPLRFSVVKKPTQVISWIVTKTLGRRSIHLHPYRSFILGTRRLVPPLGWCYFFFLIMLKSR